MSVLDQTRVDGGSHQVRVTMETVVTSDNMRKAYQRVVSNKGSAGIDGMQVEDLKAYLQVNWEGIKRELLESMYYPQAVRSVKIPKPGGGERELGFTIKRGKNLLIDANSALYCTIIYSFLMKCIILI